MPDERLYCMRFQPPHLRLVHNNNDEEAVAFAREIRDRETKLLAGVDEAWRLGWQPAELVRSVRRDRKRDGESLILHAIAADHSPRDPASLHPRWSAQLDTLTLPRVAGPNGWLLPWHRSLNFTQGRLDFIVANVALHLHRLQPIARLIPPPGSPEATAVDLTSPVDDPMLQRVRALLAQAESTTFDAEAETFMAKAQELMTRHAITEAMLDARRANLDAPTTARIAIDEPYLSQKVQLLHVVAKNTRSRCVQHVGDGMCSVIGMANDVAATDMLFTSLLVQGSAALQQHSAARPKGTAADTRDFRKSFWFGFSHRIGARLAAINEYITADLNEQHGGTLLPVLASQSTRINHAVSEMFPRMTSCRTTTGNDPAGWASGHASADTARINTGTVSTGHPSGTQSQRPSLALPRVL